MSKIKNRRMIFASLMQVEHGDIYIHLILCRVFDGEESMDSSDLFKCGSVGNILQFAIKNRIVSAPFTKINSDCHNKLVLCDMVGTISSGGCSCMAGNSKTYSHVGSLLD